VTSGKRRLVDDHQGIQRVAVQRQRFDDEAIVRRIVNRRIQHSIERDDPALFVQLVLVAASARDFHDDLDEVRLHAFRIDQGAS
jgi:hypothetical protein